MVENVYKNTQMEIWFNMDFNFTWNWRRFDVNVLEKIQCVHKNISGNSCVPRAQNQILA